jgi:hypothetical protein
VITELGTRAYWALVDENQAWNLRELQRVIYMRWYWAAQPWLNRERPGQGVLL